MLPLDQLPAAQFPRHTAHSFPMQIVGNIIAHFSVELPPILPSISETCGFSGKKSLWLFLTFSLPFDGNSVILIGYILLLCVPFCNFTQKTSCFRRETYGFYILFLSRFFGGSRPDLLSHPHASVPGLLPSGKRVNARRHTGALHPRGIVLLLISVVFYLFAGWQKLIFVLITALFAWLCSRWMAGIYTQMNKQAAELTDRKRKMALRAVTGNGAGGWPLCCRGGAADLWLLQVFSRSALRRQRDFDRPGPRRRQCLGRNRPLGLSYYTLSIIGYLLDVYWRKQQHEQNFLLFLLCVLYFPRFSRAPSPSTGCCERNF